MSNIKDFATALIVTAPSPATSGTSLVVATGHGTRFPATPFYATIHPKSELPTLDNAEKVLVTAISTDTFTITRAQGGTTAQTITGSSTYRISNAVFAADLFNTTIIKNETPGGTINGSNTGFTTAAAFSSGTLEVFLNGQKLRSGASNDYVEGTSAFTMNYAPATGDVLLVNYLVGPSGYTAAVGSTRNYVINGACQIAQRAVPNISTTNQYGKVDRFRSYVGGTVSAGTITQGTGLSFGSLGTSQHISGLTVSSGAYLFQETRLESLVARELKNKTISASVVLYQDTGSTVYASLSIYSMNATDNFTGGTTLVSQGTRTAIPTATATTIRIENISAADTSNGITFGVQWFGDAAGAGLPALTTKNFHATDWQIVIGAVAPTFVPNSFQTDLFTCQRYYFKTFPYSTAPAQNAGVSGAVSAEVANAASSNFSHSLRFPISMVATPTVTTYNPSAANANWRDATNTADRTVTVSDASPRGVNIRHTGSGAANSYNNIHVTADADV
jgi:hypothetical protein